MYHSITRISVRRFIWCSSSVHGLFECLSQSQSFSSLDLPYAFAVTRFLFIPFAIRYSTADFDLFCDNIILYSEFARQSVCELNSIFTSGFSFSTVTTRLSSFAASSRIFDLLKS